ncbi:hypothetical protein GFS24_22575 [Chitinophaga sp. SYP-B3965]|uniref:DUF6252 family protein n=1 Tax=Chitinophaga sp. SYP-B3965 TaxID=2663120 RepID=UPI001299B03D|nr:DUF6252 family protein [Chitinophaga sp. SYP-B3965]MRG47924.1 hypothetical protein [Chitinophaga sp. SYP-B3965]
MKNILLLTAMVLLFACHTNQPKILADEITATAKANTPGFIPTSKDGYWMSAKIDGKDWTASAMMPVDKSDSRRIHGEHNGETISFSIWMRGLEPGKHFSFSEDKAADLFTNDDIGMWGGRNGEIVITKIDDKGVEGTFSFTASSSRSEKTVAVTEGRFRVPLTATP